MENIMENIMENTTLMDILNRRSIRKFEAKEVPEEVITVLLHAAMNAPSACNQRCWHFVVIRDQEIKDKLSQIHGGYHTIKNAPVSILVCGEPKAATLPSFWEHDCAAASENILIAAQSLGLGGVWQGANPAEPEQLDMVSDFVRLPEGIKPFAILSIGYPAETGNVKDKFDPNKIHFDYQW
jgi:nitroreductase